MYSDSEQELLREVSAGNQDAFRYLFNTYRKKLYTYIIKISESKEVAEDMVNDVFLKIWENREKLAQIDNLNAYIYRMAHNRAYTALRRMAKETLLIAALQQEKQITDIFEVENRVIQREVKELIQSAVNKLTPQQKLVFLLSREEGLKHDEIAKKLNISGSTVKNHLVAALRFLREEIRQSYGSIAIVLYMIYNLSHF